MVLNSIAGILVDMSSFKKLFKIKFKITVLGTSYDKNENFGVSFFLEIRRILLQGKPQFQSFLQTGFRIPTTQDQYIDYITPSADWSVGSIVRDRYNYNTNFYSLATIQQYRCAVLAGTRDPAVFKLQLLQATQCNC